MLNRPKWLSHIKFPESEARLERIAKLPPDATIRGMFFSAALETLTRSLGPGAAQEVCAQVQLADTNFSRLKTYPLAKFIALQSAVAHKLMPQVGVFELCVAKVGAAALEIFFESVAGRTMKLLASKEPHRLMSAAPNGYSLAVNDGGKREYHKTGERSGEFVFVGDGLGPCHEIGVFETAIHAACDVKAEIDLEQTGVSDFKLLVQW